MTQLNGCNQLHSPPALPKKSEKDETLFIIIKMVKCVGITVLHFGNMARQKYNKKSTRKEVTTVVGPWNSTIVREDQ